MKNSRNLWISLLVMLAILLLAACGSAANNETADAENDEHDANSNGDQMEMDTEHMDEDGEHTASEETNSNSMEHEHASAPDEFATLANPYSGDEAAIVAGREIFATNCQLATVKQAKGMVRQLPA